MAILLRYLWDQFISFILLDRSVGICISLSFFFFLFGESHFAQPLHMDGQVDLSAVCHWHEPFSVSEMTRAGQS